MELFAQGGSTGYQSQVLFLAWSVKSNVCAINLICSVSVSYFDSSQLILAISEEL